MAHRGDTLGLGGISWHFGPAVLWKKRGWELTSHGSMLNPLQLVKDNDLAAKHETHLVLFQPKSSLHSPDQL